MKYKKVPEQLFHNVDIPVYIYGNYSKQWNPTESKQTAVCVIKILDNL